MLRDRWLAFSPRERRLLIAGGAAILLFLLWLMLRGGDAATDDSGVQLASTPPPPAAAAPPPVQPAPPPAMTPIAPAPVVAAPVGLILTGVFVGGPGGGAAAIGTQGGPQRLVRVGRPVAPGVTLKEVGANYALLATATGDMRLEIARSIAPGAVPAPAP